MHFLSTDYWPYFLTSKLGHKSRPQRVNVHLFPSLMIDCVIHVVIVKYFNQHTQLGYQVSVDNSHKLLLF